MTVTILDTLPVLLNTIDADFSMADDWPWAVQEWQRILDAHLVPLFAIDDIRQMNVSLGDMVALGSRGKDPIWHHPRLRGIYFISESRLIHTAAVGLNSPTFGNTAAKAFGSLEEALEDIGRTLAAGAGSAGSHQRME